MTIDLKDDHKYLVVFKTKDEVILHGFYQEHHAKQASAFNNAQLIEL